MYVEDGNMANKENKGAGGFFSGIAIGGVIGFVAGMILAPKSGDETRTLFSERGQEFRDKADDFIAAAKERMFAASDRNSGRSDRRGYPFDDLDLDNEDL